jgi:hypothetical protein
MGLYFFLGRLTTDRVLNSGEQLRKHVVRLCVLREGAGLIFSLIST